MKKKKFIQNISKEIKQVLIIGFFILFLLYLILFVPLIVDITFGEKIIDNHIKEVVGNETNGTLIAQKIMNWIEKNTKTAYNEKKYFGFGPFWGVYNVSNKPTLFIRTNKASWFIISKLGNCGEDAWYFVEIMNKLGFRSRIIQAKGEDHVWAEFYYNNKKFVVDPSNNKFINNSKEWAKSSHWSRIVAINLNGDVEDVTKEYLTNTSQLNITFIGKKFIQRRTSVIINSLYLKKVSKLYDSPINVLTYSFKHNNSFNSFITELGSKKDYQLIKIIDLYLVQFVDKEDLDLTSNKTILLYPKDIIKIKNIRLTYISYSILFIMFLLIFFINKNKQRTPPVRKIFG